MGPEQSEVEIYHKGVTNSPTFLLTQTTELISLFLVNIGDG